MSSERKKQIVDWLKIAAIIGIIPIAVAGMIKGTAIYQAPDRLDKLEPRVATLETANLTNTIILHDDLNSIHQTLDWMKQWMRDQKTSRINSGTNSFVNNQ